MYREIEKVVKENGHSMFYRNTDGELVTIHHIEDEDGARYEVTTSQNNGWERKNIYWKDGTVEELYRKA